MGAQGNRIDKILQYLEKLYPSLQHIIKFYNTNIEERDQAREHSKGLQNVISEIQRELSESKTLCSTMHEHALLQEVNYAVSLNRFQVLLMKVFLRKDILIKEVLPLVEEITKIKSALSQKKLSTSQTYTAEYQRKFKLVVASRIKEYQESDSSQLYPLNSKPFIATKLVEPTH